MQFYTDDVLVFLTAGSLLGNGKLCVVQRNVYILTDSLTPRQLCIKEANLVLCDIALVSFPDEGPLRIETHRNAQCDMAI